MEKEIIIDQSIHEPILKRGNQQLIEDLSNSLSEENSDNNLQYAQIGKKKINQQKIKKLWEEKVKSSEQLNTIVNKQSFGSNNNQNIYSVKQKKQFPNISDEAVNNLKKNLEKYKFSNITNRMQSIQRQRADVKEKFLTYLLYGYQELKQLEKDELDQKEKQIALQFLRKISINLETTLFGLYNKQRKSALQRSYIDRYRVILANLKDDDNRSLRRKIINSTISIYNVCTVKQIQLYNEQKQNQIRQKQLIILKKNTIEQKPSSVLIHSGVIEMEDAPHLSYQYDIKTTESQIQNKTTINPNLQFQRKSFHLRKQLHDLINQEQKFKERLQQLEEDQKNFLIDKLNKLYSIQ